MNLKNSLAICVAAFGIIAVSSCGSSTSNDVAGTSNIQLTPVGKSDGILAIPVRIEGKTVNLVVATEAPVPTLSAKSASELRLVFDREITINDADGAQSEMRVTKSIPVSPAGVEGISTTSPFIVFDRDLAPLRIDGVIPPQLFSDQTCLELSFIDQTAGFLYFPCPSGDGAHGLIELKTGDLMDAQNRLFFEGTNPYGQEGKIIVATGSEVSIFARGDRLGTGAEENCTQVSSMSEDECIPLSSGSEVKVGGVTLEGSRARSVDSLSVEDNVVGVIGADMLQSTVLRLSGTQYTLIIVESEN